MKTYFVDCWWWCIYSYKLHGAMSEISSCLRHWSRLKDLTPPSNTMTIVSLLQHFSSEPHVASVKFLPLSAACALLFCHSGQAAVSAGLSVKAPCQINVLCPIYGQARTRYRWDETQLPWPEVDATAGAWEGRPFDLSRGKYEEMAQHTQGFYIQFEFEYRNRQTCQQF